ncbi:MAG: hypothetical protein M1822_003713 [Bathelium mastoideum]|nr:MAG: hypothetical protein M1822_003713 [Bathelium mastoideum]
MDCQQYGRPTATALLAAGIIATVLFVAKFLASRRFIYGLQKANLCMPKYNALTGHLLLLKERLSRLPADCTINTAFLDIAKDFPNGMFYFDLWPFSKPLLFVNTPSAAMQLQQILLDKPEEIDLAFQNLCGGPNLFTMPEKTWRPSRHTFNPGFSASYMLELVPQIATQTRVFCHALRKQAASGGGLMLLENLTLKLTVDVIMAVVMDTELHFQEHDHPFASALRTQIEWTSFGAELNPFNRYNFMRPLILWWNCRRLNRFIHREIDNRFRELRHDKSSENGQAVRQSKSIISLTLKNYLKEQGMENTSKVDKQFLDVATAQLRLFLFAGHDTTSSTLIYCYHLLATHPDAMLRIRAEHDEVIGANSSSAVYEALVENPQLLNNLPFTLVVIKEALRLFPPASGIRTGRPDVNLVDDDGKVYPTEGCTIWTMHVMLQRNPKYWKDPHSFIPERWLVGPEDPLYPVKGAWRPFEFGPRNCLGQSLAVMEIKVVLAMTIREFDICPAYEEWDALHNIHGPKTVFGNRVYQVEGGGGGAHPSERYPCTIALRN